MQEIHTNFKAVNSDKQPCLTRLWYHSERELPKILLPLLGRESDTCETSAKGSSRQKCHRGKIMSVT